MSDSQFANVNGSMPTTPVAVESKEQPTNHLKLYEVSVAAKHGFDVDFQTDSVALVENDVDVLNAEVKDLHGQVVWNTISLAKHKAFLESLLNDDDAAVPVRQSYSVMGLAEKWRISEDDVWSLLREFDRNVREWQALMEATSPIPDDFAVIPRQLAEMIRPSK